MKYLLEKSMSINEFYSELPKLQNKYQESINRSQVINCDLVESVGKEFTTKYIIAFAYRSCIDSVINLNALKCVESQLNINVSVIIDTKLFEEKYPNRSTPLIVGLNENYNAIWEWERVPEEIREIENASDQSVVIKEKRNYRNGKYISNTIDEIMNLL